MISTTPHSTLHNHNHNTHYYPSHTSIMTDLEIELTAPNGRKYAQPIGLFINNEFVKSKSGEKITSINPAYGPASLSRCSNDANP